MAPASSRSGPVKTSACSPAPARVVQKSPENAAARGARTPLTPEAVAAPLPRPFGHGILGRLIQRKLASCPACPASPEREERRPRPQLKAEAAQTPAPPGAGLAIPAGGGRPLAPETRSLMESHFGEDFREVRVHTDPAAAAAARQLQAQAFTLGRDVYFGPGHGSGETAGGRELLAHELAHVLQQRRSAAPPGPARAAVSAPGDAFEMEAERAARNLGIVQPPVTGLSSAPAVQRKKAQGTPSGKGLSGTEKIRPIPDPLTVPKEKGNGEVKTEYKRAVKDRRLGNLAKFSRPSTDTLRATWKDKTGCKFPEDLKPGGYVCEVDHIVELQVGGTNNKENLQLLEKSHNASSGSNIRSQLDALKTKYGSDEVLRFTKVEFEEPAVEDRCKKEEEKLKVKGAKVVAEARVASLIFGRRTIDVALNKEPVKEPPTVYDLSGRRGQIVAGLAFSKLTWPGDGNGRIDATVTSGAERFIKDKALKNVVLNIKNHKVSIAPECADLKLLFPFLSESTLKMRIDNGLEGEGKFNPTLPLLKRSEVQLKIADGKFSGGVKVGPAQVNLPIPGVMVTESSLEARLDEGQFSAAGNLSFKVSTFAEAKLKAHADAAGFAAQGTCDFFIPGVAEARGTLTYAKSKLSGHIEVGKDKFKLPGVKSARLLVDVTDTGLAGTGEIILAVPGIKKGTLGFALDKQGAYVVTGLASLAIPGLKEAEIGLALRDGDLEGLGKVGLSIPGLEGAGANFTLKYAKGILTGSGDFQYHKGRLGGKVQAGLDEKRRLYGGGRLDYQVIPGLVAGVGLELRPNGTAKISGQLQFPDKIDLFPQKAIDKKLFGYALQIPIFAIPLGPRSIGLVAEVGADMKARAGIGPGQIRQLKVMAAFDPSHEESRFEFSGGGELYVPAFAELALAVHGGIGLSLAIAAATGGIELQAALGLQGALSAMVQIAYLKNQFAVKALAELSAQPSLRFDVNAYVKIDASVILATFEVYRKDWKLASKEWGSGLKIGLRFPVNYVFGQPFEISLSQVEFIVPKIDVKQAVKDLLPK